MKNFRKILAIVVCIVMMVTFVPILPGIEAEASTFTPRTTQPDSSNAYYYANNVFYQSGYGMPNCTAYAYGRAYEILGSKPNLCTSNACDWYNYNKNHGYYSYGSTPKLGAIACWGSNDGKAGHVAVVEVINGSTVTLSESHYGGTYWDLKTMNSDGSDYLTAKGFQGYIYIGDFSSNAAPVICLDSISGGVGSLTVTGWAYDPDSPSTSIDVHVYIGGAAGSSDAYGVSIGSTSVYRSDVNSAFGISGNHGFSYTIELTDTGVSGTKNVYIYALDTGGGDNTCVQSSAAITKNSSPVGYFDSVAGHNGSVTVAGWAYDPDSSSSAVTVHIYVGGPAGAGTHVGTVKTTVTRSDVNSAYGISGNHGFSTTVDLTGYSYTGSQPVYVYALDLSGRINTLLTNSPKTATISSPYTVTYNANGGSGAPSTQKKAYGINLTLSSAKPTRTGYTFKNWNTASGGTGTSYSAGATYTANSSTTLYAQWTANTYTIAYNANGGSGAPSSQTKTYGTALTLSSTVPTRTGYTFAGWNTASDGSGTSYAAGASYTANAAATLYAQWTINTYTIIYNANGGSGAPSSQTKTYNTALTLSSTVPTRTGYMFAGWNTAADGSGTSYAAGASYTANSAVTLYAQWTTNTYTITYDANGGSGAPSSQTKTYGTALTLSSTKPTRTGYTFTGWNTAADGSGTSYAVGASYTANASVTLYAQWTIITYTITYDANGGNSAPSSQTKTYGTALTLSSMKPARTGYTFAGWNTAADGSGTSYAAGASYTVNAAATLYAQWTINTYIITYDANGGSGAPSSQAKTYGTALTLSDTVPMCDGYTFVGWNTSADGSGTSYAAGASYTANASVTLYAQWTIITYTITYDANGGSGAPSSQTKTYGTALMLSDTVPTRTGYEFKNWNTAADGSGTSYAAGASYTENASVTLYAQWFLGGTCGDDVTWELDDDGTLRIYGTGNMTDYTKTKAPWYSYCDEITAVVITGDVTSIGARAFSDCTALKSVSIPESVTSIGSSAFSECTALKSVSIAQSVTSIGTRAFQNCSALEEIEIPSSVTSIENMAFAGCESLVEINIPNSVTSLGDQVFYNCYSLKSITIPEGIEEIGSWMFMHCTALESVVLPSSLTSLGWCAFGGCTALEEINIPESVTTIGKEVFEDCTALTGVKIPESVTSIGSQAFSGCTQMTSINIPSGVTCIESHTFSGCTALESIYIGSGMEKIAAYSFTGCDALENIYYAGSQEDWENVTVEENSGIESATVYYNMSEIPGEAGLYTVNYIKGGTAASGEFYAEVSVTKNAAKSGADVVIAAAYKDGALVAVGSAEIQISSGETTILQIDLDADEACELKAFVWDSLNSMTPLGSE